MCIRDRENSTESLIAREELLTDSEDVSDDLSLRSVSILPPDLIPEMSVVLIVVLLGT